LGAGRELILDPDRRSEHDLPMANRGDPDRNRRLPEPVRPEEYVETVDVSTHPGHDEERQERERLARTAGGAG
jgi:hypothetical protein